jgi:glycerol-3-phosphate acyltransferase PlsY
LLLVKAAIVCAILFAIIWAMPSAAADSAVILFYLYGSIPFPLIIIFLAGKGDIFRSGSTNIGVANAYRTGGLLVGTAVVLAEISKVALPMAASYALFSWQISVTVSLLAAVLLGTCFSIFINLRGGVGVTIAIYSLLVLAPLVLILVAAAYLLLELTLKDSYWCLLLAYAAGPVFMQLLGSDASLVLLALLGAGLIAIKYDRRIDEVSLEKGLRRGAV